MSKKTNAQLLETFKKANKERRLGMAKKAGYATAEEYFLFLTGAVVASTTKAAAKARVSPSPSLTIHNVHILDRSGSMMGGKLRNAVAGINQEVEELKRMTDATYTQTLVTFDHVVDTRMIKTPIQEVRPLSTNAGGSTALYDAIGQTLTLLMSTANGTDKYLVKIFTDGQENASRVYNSFSVASLIKEAEAKGFTITFVGTASDVQYVQNNLHVDSTNTLVHDNTSRGVETAFKMSMSATQTYAKRALAGEDVTVGFYSKKVGKL